MNFIYGTAWKEDLTRECVLNALRAGFRAIDTANQRKHYFEEGVGDALSASGVKRNELFLQTKFTYSRGQDHRKPYDDADPFPVQVRKSFESSLQHLKTDYLDSLVLHGPYSGHGLSEADWEVWEAMEGICRTGGARKLGVSNVDHDQLMELFEGATIKPSYVQNRCFAETRWDQEIRDFCAANGIRYQGFSLLTANWRFLGGKTDEPEGSIGAIAAAVGKTVEQVIFRFAQQIGMIPITGTRTPEHMKQDLAIQDFSLSPDQIEKIRNIALTS